MGDSSEYEPYTKRYLKEKLLEKYGQSIYFTNDARRNDILCFQNKTSSIVRDYQKNFSLSEEDQVKSILQTAVKILKNDIKIMKIKSEVYPTISEMASNFPLPKTLHFFSKLA